MISAVSLGMVVLALVVVMPNAGAAETTCRAKNLTQGTPSHSNLQAAIVAAHPGDEIAVKGVCVGSFRIDQDLTLVGTPTQQDANPVLQGERGSGSVVHVAAHVTLSNLRVTGGVAGGGEGPEDGGGIYVGKGGTLTLNRAVVRGNRAWYEGGGIANYGGLTLDGSSVTGNRADDTSANGHGGGIANYGTLILNGSSSVRGNSAGNTGGGIVNYGTLVLNGSSTVQGNTAELGGGISLADAPGQHTDPTVTMNDSSSVRANTAESGDDGGNGSGGGFFVNAGTVTLRDSSSVTQNMAGAGGGIANYGTVTLEDTSSVRRNTAENEPGQPSEGGGIWSSGTVILKDSASVTRNRATSDGGGVYNLSNTFTVNDSASVRGNTTALGENDVGGFVPTTAMEWLAGAVALIWILAAIVAALIGGPWTRAAALATFTGLLGAFLTGLVPGVMIGALLGAAIIRLAGYRADSRKTWPTRRPTTIFLLSALVVSTVLVKSGLFSSALPGLVDVLELSPVSAGRLTPILLLLLLVLLIGVAAAGTAYAALRELGVDPRARR